MPVAGSPLASGTPAKPKLKINISRQHSFAGDHNAPLPTATPASAVSSTTAATPTANGPRVIKLKRPSASSIKTPVEPALPPSAKTKAGRQTKPTQKVVEASRPDNIELYDDDIRDFDGVGGHAPPLPKIKLKAKPKTPTTQVVIKSKGKAPKRELGTGYDSEASDREEDPVIEEQFILRMMPGEHCDYMQKAIEENKWDPRMVVGHPGADIFMRFLDEGSGRAILSVKGQMFAAVMVDLPTITESMKTWDRKAFIKSADICQMLLVFQKVATEQEALFAPLPAVIDNSTTNHGGPTAYRWPHGLTPPMHDCIKRRFAKTLSRKEIQDKEKEVERLLAADREAKDSRFAWIDDKPEVQPDEGSDDDEQDAEGEEDEPNQGEAAVESQAFDDADLEAEMEAALDENLMEEQNTPGTHVEGATPATVAAETPADRPAEESADDEDDEDDEDGDEDDEEIDEEEQARLCEIQGVKDIIEDLRKQLAQKQADLVRQTLPILRQRLESSIRTLKSEIQLKLASIGEEEED